MPYSMNSSEDMVLVYSVEGNTGAPLNQRYLIYFLLEGTPLCIHMYVCVCILLGRYTVYMEKEMAIHSSILAWRIPGTEEPGGLPSMGSHRVRHDWSDLAAAAPYNIYIYIQYIYNIQYIYIWQYVYITYNIIHTICTYNTYNIYM